ncbi:hypothetical protein ES332_D13G219500v1 [Gossypium tomentosum]|uniref:Uncharacterized protein n=1 Tax=Gossypium tomentosum TaxID=34277 RepID=A0A5D2I1X6_GOSTO|nr:hypothetical protein ES332_D13G219500v1 [Gossypium tomentosum]
MSFSLFQCFMRKNMGISILCSRDKMKTNLLKMNLFVVNISDECPNNPFVGICSLAFLYYYS